MKEIKDDTNREMMENTNIMFLDWKNEYTSQSNLQSQCNPFQTTNGIFHTTRTNNFTICMEIQKNLEQPKQS